jgi:hypothetical protein
MGRIFNELDTRRGQRAVDIAPDFVGFFQQS